MGLVCPPMFLGAIRTAGLPWYGRLPAILAEACVFQLAARASTARALARSCRSSGVRRTRFGFLDAFGFAAVVTGFETLRARARAAAGLAGFFFLCLGSGSWS